MSVDQMREAITKVYPAVRWQKKVAKMSDDQVMAIYFKFAQCGKMEKPVVVPRSYGRDYIREQLALMHNRPVRFVEKGDEKASGKDTDGYTSRSGDSDGYTIHQITFDELMRQT